MNTQFQPKAGEACMYMETGGVNWCMCKIIAQYEGKVWLHNFYTGSTPVKRLGQVKFEPLPSYKVGAA